jgi:hypothetical protein
MFEITETLKLTNAQVSVWLENTQSHDIKLGGTLVGIDRFESAADRANTHIVEISYREFNHVVSVRAVL